jgi:uncharacterized protein (TIGR03067 family)
MPAASVLKAPDQHGLSELEELQGTWASVAGPRPAILLIAGTRYTFEFLDGDIYMGTFFLDIEEDPKQMDMLIEEGPPDQKGQIALCIFDVEGGVLRWCPTKPGSDRRLKKFPSVSDDRYNSTVFRHLRPRRANKLT